MMMLSLPAMDDLLSVAEEDESGSMSAASRKQPSCMVIDGEHGLSSAISSPTSPYNTSRSSFPNFGSGNSSSNSNGGRICGASSSSVHSSSSQTNTNTNTLPPAFNDLVKRSTRFITAVPAYEVLEKVETILESVRIQRTSTPIGLIGKVELNWDRYRLEVWGMDTQGAALCALQLYQMPSSSSSTGSTASLSVQSSPERNFGSRIGQVAYSPATASLYESPFVVGSLGGTMPSSSPSFSTLQQQQQQQQQQQPQQLYLVEFIRGQLEIFAFKRFYQWVRHRLSELVKRDYSIRLFEQASSPMYV